MSFQDQIDDWILRSTELTEAVLQDAAQEMAIEANTPVSQGGRMRVDTGFLRNSIAAQVGSLPSGPNIQPEGFNNQDWNPEAIAIAINNWRLGQTLFIGWTANYAQARENRDFFARTVQQRWPEFVSQSVQKLRLRANVQ